MKKSAKNLKLFSVLCALILAIAVIGESITFAKFSDGYDKGADGVKIANAFAKIEVNSIYRTDSQKNKISVAFDKKAQSIMLYDVEPEDKIEYYFTLSGIEGQEENEVTLNVTLSITVRLETIATDGSGKHVDYFGGWTLYTDKEGVKDGAYLEIYHGAENGSSKDIRPSSKDQDTSVDFTGNSLTRITDETGVITNKTGLVMAADDAKKEYPYHLAFTLPRQNAEKENYAGARVFFEIQAIAEQAPTK